MPVWAFDTKKKLDDAGYRFVDTGKCLAPSCEKTIHWYLTPKGHYMPMEIIEREPGDDGTETKYTPHFSTCPDARKFSRRENGTVKR